MTLSRSACIVAIVVIVSVSDGLSQVPPQYHHHQFITPTRHIYGPYEPWTPPPTRPATVHTARELWEQRREARRRGVRPPTSPVSPVRIDDDTEDSRAEDARRFPGTPSSERPPPPRDFSPILPPELSPSTDPPPTTAPSEAAERTETAPPEARPLDPPRSTETFQSFLHRSLFAIVQDTLEAPWSADGANPTKGFSPEGLVRYVFGRLGYPPPEGNLEDFLTNYGLPLGDTWRRFQPGDILFFKLYSRREQRGRLFVGIVVQHGEMVYSSYARGKVIQRSYQDEFWRERFVGARRVFVH